jgi:ribonuclease HI
MKNARKHLVLYFAGHCEPNPLGIASYGWVVFTPESLGYPHPDPGTNIDSGSGIVHTHRNSINVAEYHALGHGLRCLLYPSKRSLGMLTIRGDSQLVIRQLNGDWACLQPHLLRLRDRCRALLGQLGCRWVAQWIEQNEAADALSVRAWEAEAGRAFPRRPRSQGA